MIKKRVIKREIAEKHIRIRPKHNSVKVRTNIVIDNPEIIEEVVEDLPVLKEEEAPKPRKVKKHKAEETEKTENNE